MPTMSRAATTLLTTGTDVRGKNVLVVGAGGIGCELIKNLVLMGFEKVTMIDLDTIDYSNLNRQFLFRSQHVGRSKAEVAREAVLEFPHDPLEIDAERGNIKSTKYSLEFFQEFSIVLNALDNVDARRHVNRVCLAAGVPLIESGTEGYLGQVRAILKGRTQCYECNPPPPKKTYPVCTIRNHPDKPEHCIAWAKELLFKKIFGGEVTDLIDPTEGAAEGDESGGASESADPSDAPAGGAGSLQREQGEDAGAFAARLFSAVFDADVERLLRMDDVSGQKINFGHGRPEPINLAKLTLPTASSLEEVDQREWSVEESAAVFVESVRAIFDERPDEVGSLKFDKDDPQALDFVTAASNLRSTSFHIPRLSRFKVKEIAGSIIPAIATTNAIIAGFIVLEALKVLGGRADECRYCLCVRAQVGRKRDLLLQGSGLDPPSKECHVCVTTSLRCVRARVRAST
jgi:ubiquitin-like 1-activating enzyme E1 B